MSPVVELRSAWFTACTVLEAKRSTALVFKNLTYDGPPVDGTEARHFKTSKGGTAGTFSRFLTKLKVFGQKICDLAYGTGCSPHDDTSGSSDGRPARGARAVAGGRFE